MNRVVSGIAVLALALVVAPAARAADPTLAGDVCHIHVSDYDPTQPGEIETSILSGGPIVAATLPTMYPALFRDTFANPVSVTLTCTVRTDWYFTHNDPSVASASATGTAVAVLAPTVVSYPRPFSVPPGFACTDVLVRDAYGDSKHLYWDEYNKTFSTDPGVQCSPVQCPLSAGTPARSTDSYDPCKPLVDISGAIRDLLELLLPYVEDGVGVLNAVLAQSDAITCPVLGSLAPGVGPLVIDPTGDVWLGSATPENLLWDCPPYIS